MIKLRFIFLLSFCYAASSFQATSSTMKKIRFAGNIFSDPRCVNVTNYEPNSRLSGKGLCKTLCIQNKICTGFLFNETSCILSTFMVLPPLATDVGTEYYSLQDADDSSTAVDIARYKNAVAPNGYYVPPATYSTYATSTTVTSGVLCYQSITDCWCGNPSNIYIDLGAPMHVSKVVIIPHPEHLTIFGINLTTIYVENSNYAHSPTSVFAVIQTVPTAGQKITLSGSMTGQFISITKVDPYNFNLCSCFIQAFS